VEFSSANWNLRQKHTIMKVRTFRDLKVWRLSHELSIDVSALVKDFPKHEKYDLADNIRRAARSIPSNISEGFVRYHFNDKLTFYERAYASLQELKNHFSEALANKYVSQRSFDGFDKRMNEIGFLPVRLMKGIKQAKKSHLKKKNSIPS
jgi:four helix bundle protein